MSRFDLSIAQRLALGFGVLLAILVGLVAFVFDRHETSSAAQREYHDEIAPRRERALELESAVLSMGIALRSHELLRDDTRLLRFRESRAAVLEAVRRLEAGGGGGWGDGGRIRPLVERYVAMADRIVSRPDEAMTPGQEQAIVDTRDALIGGLGALLRRERLATADALSAMSEARESVRRALIGAAALMLVCAIGLGWVTTQAIARPLRGLVRAAEALEADDWRPALALAASRPARPAERSRNEVRVLAGALGAAAVALDRRAQRLRADGEIASAAASTLDRTVLAERALEALVTHAGAEVGVLYGARRGAGQLEPLARHAIAQAPPVAAGDGLPGQAARDGRLHVVRDIPADSPFAVRIGYDQAPPRAVAAVPLRVRDEVHGVAVIGSLRELDADALAFLEAAGGQLGIALQNAAAHEEIERLLADLRESNQQLQAQSEELQAQNEEIQAQNEEIQAQNEELQAQQDELQRRTRDLETYSGELRRHAAMLAEADERKNEFLGLLAHELRNPLAPMTVSLLILEQSPPGSERALRAQAVIERQVRHLSRLIDDLLDVTRISHGKIQIAREPLELVEVVRSCIEDQHGGVAEKNLQLDVDLPDTAIWVDGDRTRLCQVLNNLLSNASKFTDAGGRIQVRLAADEPDAVIEVADSGAGIEAELLPRIFQPFTQGTTSLARANGGLGLGLALVRALVELHGGTVSAHSDGPGTGARFVVRLPTRPAAAPTPAPDAAPASAQRYRVLLVEDNRDAALSLKEALELQGHQVDVAHTGPEGLEKATALVPDLVLCDIGLPAIDGYEVARRLRADDRLRSTLLVALSGYAAEQDRARAQAAGFDRHVAKPLTLELLGGIFDQVQTRYVEGEGL